MEAGAEQMAVRAGEECDALVLFIAWTMSYKGGSRLCRLPCSTEGYLWRSDTRKLYGYSNFQIPSTLLLAHCQVKRLVQPWAPSLSRQLSEAQAGVLG